MPVGAIAPCADGTLIVACRDGFAVLDVDDDRVTMIAPLRHRRSDMRMNDGKCDPAGRFWASTMSDRFAPGAGALHRLGPDLRPVEVLRSLTIPNGLGWSADGRVMYFIDSAARTLFRFAYDVATGRPTDPRPLVVVPPEVGSPDGMAVDAEGGLWVAMWGGGAVHRFSPEGEHDRSVTVPEPMVTSCAFGGAELDELYVTTAAAYGGHRGAVYVARPGVRGAAPTPFRGPSRGLAPLAGERHPPAP